MKDFADFKNSMTSDKIADIIDARIDIVSEREKDITFENATDRLVWTLRSHTVGMIFDFLEEYHNWLNA